MEKDKKEKIKPRSEYNNLESYDDEVDIVEDVLAAAEEAEDEILFALEEALHKLCELYKDWFPFYFPNGVLNRDEYNKLILSLQDGSQINTAISEALDEIKKDIEDLEQQRLLSFLIFDYEMTKDQTIKSIGDKGPKLMYNPYVKNKRPTQDIVKQPWCKDHKSFVVRIRDNVQNLDMRLRAVIIKGFANGWSPQKMGEFFRQLTGMEAYKAQRLLRTEAMAAYSRATKEAYLEKGIKYVEIIGDAACGGICLDYVGEAIPLEEAEIGDLLPPYHPNCACSFCSYDSFDENF